MPTLVYKLKFEIDKSKIKGIDKIVSNEVKGSIKSTTSELQKLSQASGKASSSSSKLRKEVEELASSQRTLESTLSAKLAKYKHLEKADGLRAKSTQKVAGEIRKLKQQISSVTDKSEHYASRLKLTEKEEQSLANTITKGYNAQGRAIAVDEKRKLKLEQTRIAQEKLNQEQKEASTLLIQQSTSLDRLQQEYDSTVGSANKFSDSMKSITRSFKTNLTAHKSNHRATAEGMIQTKQNIRLIDDQIRSVTGLIHSGKLDDNQKKEAQRTLNKLNSEKEQAINVLRRYRKEVKQGTDNLNRMTAAEKRRKQAMDRASKSMAIGNQLAFSFGDLINDAAQFNYGFATGMRAIGNNISFTAEMFMLLNMQAAMSGKTLTGLLKATMSPLVIGLLALNTAVSLVTVVTQRMEAAAKKTAMSLDDFLGSVRALKREAEGFSFMNANQIRLDIEVLESMKPIFDEITQAKDNLSKTRVEGNRYTFREDKAELERLEKAYGFTAKEVEEANEKLETLRARLKAITAREASSELAQIQKNIDGVKSSSQLMFETKGEFKILEEAAKQLFALAGVQEDGSDAQMLYLKAAKEVSGQLEEEKSRRDELAKSTAAQADEVRKLNEEALQEGREEKNEKILKKEAEDFVKSYKERYDKAQETVDRFGMHGLRHGKATFEMLREEKMMMMMNNEFVKEQFDKLLTEEQKFQQARQKILADDPSRPSTDDDQALQEALAVEQLMFDTSLFGLDEHERKKLEIARKYDQMRLDFIRQGMHSQELMRAIDAAKHAELEEAKTDKEKTEQEKRREFLDTALAFTGQFVGAFGALKQQEINNELKAAKARKASATEIDKINRKKFESNKRMQLANAVINTAEAVTERLDKPLLAAAIGALGAIQIATIASTKYESASVGSVGSASGAGASGGIMSSTDTNQAPTQRISFMPTAQDSTPDQKTEINVNLDRGGLAANVRKGEREIAASQVRR